MSKATGNRKKLDKDGDGKITGKDLAMLRSGKKGKTMKKTKNGTKKMKMMYGGTTKKKMNNRKFSATTWMQNSALLISSLIFILAIGEWLFPKYLNI